MECLVELYDQEQINNLIVVLALRPKKAIFLYDKRDASPATFHAIEKACKSRINPFTLEAIEIDSKHLENIYETCKTIIHQNPECFFDITGGGQIGAIAAYLICKKTFTPLFTLDIEKDEIINVLGSNFLEKRFVLPKLSMETLLMSHGATIHGNNHPKPPAELYGPILSFCSAIFENIGEWKDLCFYFQMALSQYGVEYNPLLFVAPKKISSGIAKAEVENLKLIFLAEQLGFIKNLQCEGKKISFSFKNAMIKKYMTDYGTWLELFVYITLKKAQRFHDVRMSVKINWESGRKDVLEIINEVDVTFFHGVHPVFVSCKLSEPASEALQELSVYRTYFGGRHSKCILVTLASIKKDRSYVLRRARDMNISVIDGSSIKNGTFLDQLKEALDSN